MKRRDYVMIGVVCASVLLALCRPARAADAVRGFDLTRLTTLRERGLSPEGVAQRYLSFLVEETAQPSPTRRGLGGGDITHDYILTQIVLAGALSGASRDVLWAAATVARPGEYRDCIQLTLGLLGDTRVRDFLIRYLGDPDNSPRLRDQAARALGRVPHPSVVAPLAAALQDPASEVVRGVGPARKAYYIRGTARGSLKKVERAGVALPAAVQQAMAAAVTTEPLPQGSK
ncbi:MAG: HEAT repeat domain-containing protein [Armatimonadetes bacterium]|nr:HEAT repeat domain-containing protein [Armatimonadota bacterium]